MENINFADLNQNLIFDIDEATIETVDHFDVLIRDFDEKKISTKVALLLEVPYLSKATWPATFPVFGRIYGSLHRLFVNLAVRYKQYEAINVIFLINTGSPLTYITDATFKSLSQGNESFDGENCRLNIHGTVELVGRSDLPAHHFNGINLLGANYLLAANIILTADYVNQVVKLEIGSKCGEN